MNRKEFRSRLLDLLKGNARMPLREMAERLAVTQKAVETELSALEAEGVVLGYTAVIAPEKEGEQVRALIEVQVQPERDSGFNSVAERLARFDEVVSVYLVSGHYDLHLEVVGRSLQDVAHFVASKLASQPGVRSCATLFLLKKYKEGGFAFEPEQPVERLKVSP